MANDSDSILWSPELELGHQMQFNIIPIFGGGDSYHSAKDTVSLI